MSDSFPKRGEIFWVCLDPTVGTEVKKTRPGLILSNNSSNKFSKRVIIAPITSSTEKCFQFQARIQMPKGVKKVMLDQIRSVDKVRLRGQICSVSQSEMQEVERALRVALALK
ncbi:MAG: Endoribonuclease EndoA [Chlamydiae bacterium]|nr:Endoribonuclease EndoA [Chlamydiota bacterium]